MQHSGWSQAIAGPPLADKRLFAEPVHLHRSAPRDFLEAVPDRIHILPTGLPLPFLVCKQDIRDGTHTFLRGARDQALARCGEYLKTDVDSERINRTIMDTTAKPQGDTHDRPGTQLQHFADAESHVCRPDTRRDLMP